MSLSIVNDLKAVLGSCGLTRIGHITALEGAQLVTGPAEVYSLEFFASAAGGDARWNLMDATSTGEGGTAKYTYRPTTGDHVVQFIRPLRFNRGLAIVYTATAGSFSYVMQYSPLKTTIG